MAIRGYLNEKHIVLLVVSSIGFITFGKLTFLSEISNDIVSTKIYDKRDEFDFGIVNLPIFRW